MVSMRVALLTHSNPFRQGVCEAILEGGAQVVAATEPRPRPPGLLRLRRMGGEAFRRAAPGLHAAFNSDPFYRFLRTRGIPCARVWRARDPRFGDWLRRLAPDVVVLSRFGQRLPAELLTIPRLGFVNIHCSLLPKLRGPSPIHGAIILDHAESGVTLHVVDETIDTGDILLQRRFSLDPQETNASFTEKALRIMCPMVAEVIRMLRTGRYARVPQDHSEATYFSVRRTFGRFALIDWSAQARLIDAVVRSGVPCHTRFKARAIRVWQARVAADTQEQSARPGVVLARADGRLTVMAADAPVELTVGRMRRNRWWSLRDYEDMTLADMGGRGLLSSGRLPEVGTELETRPWPELRARTARDRCNVWPRARAAGQKVALDPG